MSTPFSNASIWSSRDAPPYTGKMTRSHSLPIGCNTSATCNASSRVGTKTRPRGARTRAYLSAHANIGTPNASVLPEPVLARPQTSNPRIATGMASVWMAKGAEKPAAAKPWSTVSGTPSAAKPVGVEIRGLVVGDIDMLRSQYSRYAQLRRLLASTDQLPSKFLYFFVNNGVRKSDMR